MKRKFYSDEFKLFAVQVALTDENSHAKTAHSLGIHESMLFKWISKFTSGELVDPHCAKATGEDPLLTAEQQQKLRNEHAQRLNFIYDQAEKAWIATRGESRDNDLQKLQQSLQSDFIAGMPWDEKVIEKIIALVETIFPAYHIGDPRFLDKMLSALADERKMWDANLTGKKSLPNKEPIIDEKSLLSDDERVILISKLFEDAEIANNAQNYSTGAAAVSAES